MLVVEHDADTIRHADYVLDLGPGAGVHGGELVAAGAVAEIEATVRSLTGQYLRGELAIPIPKKRLERVRRPRLAGGARCEGKQSAQH